MQSDDVVWGIINNQFCSYKVKQNPGSGSSHNKAVGQNFCKNEYNVTGLCNRTSCPLANSRYATVREIGGVVYLFQKTAERAHSPANLWEKTRLSSNYAKALEQISTSLIYWPDFLIHKCKQRLTKITQYLIKMRRLRNTEQPQLAVIKSKTERRERARESKALSAARLTKTLEKELIARLKSRAYGDAPLNVNEDVWRAVLEGEKRRDKEGEEELELEDEESEEDDEDDLEDLEEEEGEEEEEREFVSDLEDLSDMEDWDELGSAAASDEDVPSGSDMEAEEPSTASKGKRKATDKPQNGRQGKKAKRRPKVEVEYEEEREVERPRDQMAW